MWKISNIRMFYEFDENQLLKKSENTLELIDVLWCIKIFFAKLYDNEHFPLIYLF